MGMGSRPNGSWRLSLPNDTHDKLAEELAEWVQERAEDFLQTDDHLEEEEVETPDSGVLLGFFITCEWVGTDGGKWLTYHRPRDQAVWATRGLLSEALHDLP
jgi:thiamine kinase-like enzyme